jgi:hypothetical protein
MHRGTMMALPRHLMSVAVVKRCRVDVTRHHGSDSHEDEQQGNNGTRFTEKNCEHRTPLCGEAQHIRWPNGIPGKTSREKSKRVYSGSGWAVKMGLSYPFTLGLLKSVPVPVNWNERVGVAIESCSIHF